MRLFERSEVHCDDVAVGLFVYMDKSVLVRVVDRDSSPATLQKIVNDSFLATSQKVARLFAKKEQ